MPYFKTGQSKLYFEEYGAGPPVILLHGVGGNHASWFNQVPEFSKRYRTVVFDQRAFGNSEDQEKVGRTAFLDDLLKLMEHLGLKKTYLVSQSMGGVTAASFTAHWPSRVAGVVLADSLGGGGLGDPYDAECAALTERNAHLTQQERVLGPKIRAANKALSLLYTQIASFNSVNFRTVQGETPSWSYDDLGASGVPIVFIVGEDDVLFPPRLVRAAHERVPGSKYHVLPNAGHSAYFETPHAFNDIVLTQLDAWTAQGDLQTPEAAIAS